MPTDRGREIHNPVIEKLISGGGKPVEIPAHPTTKDDAQVFEAELAEKYNRFLQIEATRREFLIMGFLVVVAAFAGVNIVDLKIDWDTEKLLSKKTGLKRGDEVIFHSQGSVGWEDENTLGLIGPDSGKGVIKPKLFYQSPLKRHIREDGKEVSMVRVVYGKDKITGLVDEASWHEAQTLTKVEPTAQSAPGK